MPDNNIPQILIQPLKPALIAGMAQKLQVLVRVQAPDPKQKAQAAGPAGKPPRGAPEAPARGKEARRREAELRAERNRVAGPLRKKVAAMEAEIASLEAEQRRRSALLADPATYADNVRRSELLGGYQKDAATLEELTARGEVAQAELEGLEAELAAGEV